MKVQYAKDYNRQKYVFRAEQIYTAEHHIDCMEADTSAFDYKQMAAMKVAERILNNPELKLKGIDEVYEMKFLFKMYKNDINQLNPLLYNMFAKLESSVDKIIEAQDIKVEDVELEWSEKLSSKINYENIRDYK